MTLDDLDTPVLTIDLDLVERNIHTVQSYLSAHGIANRPHIKTHKIPRLAQMQVAAGAVGITCQKIGEAEVMAQAGLHDIFLPYNLLGVEKRKRLMCLCAQVTMSVTADSEFTIRGYSDAAKSEGVTLPVLVEMDTGGKRCGVQTPQQAQTLARLIDALPGLDFGGLMTYPTSDRTMEMFEATMALLQSDGIDCPLRSGGGSPKCMEAARWLPTVNEHRAGTNIYNDVNLVAVGAATWDECASRVICTVVSRPHSDRMILDGGSKTFTNDNIATHGSCGHIVEYPEAKFYSQSEEHGHVDLSACAGRPQIGDRVTVIPNHACACTNLHDQLAVHRDGRAVGIWEVMARGRIR